MEITRMTGIPRGDNDAAKDLKADAEYIEDSLYDVETLTPDHRSYLLARHGTANLIPLPIQGPQDPLNWPSWKKHVNLALVAFHGLISTAGAVGVTPAFNTWAVRFDTSITTASYLGSAQMIALAFGPLLWFPLASRYGRRPVWLISGFGSGLFNIGCALAQSYGALMTLRVFQAFFISPGIAMGQAVVAEMFFTHQRGRAMVIVLLGRFVLMLTLGPPVGPFIMGFVIQHLSWEWMFWLMAIINFAQFFGCLFFGTETLYNRNHPRTENQPGFLRQHFKFGRINADPLTKEELLLPFRVLGDLRVLIPTVAYAIVFNFTLVLIPVEIASRFGLLFHLNAQETGINFLGLLIGLLSDFLHTLHSCCLGEIVSGPSSDLWQNKSFKKAASHTTPEHRLWLIYPGFALSTAGIVIFCVTLAEAEPLHWSIRPIVGTAVAGFGAQIVTTIAITYTTDCYQENNASALGVAINVVRCTWGFTGPFWFPYMFDSCGLRGSAGLMAGIIILVSVPVILLQFVIVPRRASF
ncbi:major facilitator superfamily domain-containing protein [Talaromyces proteolyticus]|uniref:Major facilitator superfamily domain-containing protein n=1 Tax=Talaromyces proteolyticus TaxID=1131652 RepID=A0AAD4Q4U9_9EURO|nr:major facilitator superfamily domain-containing protein [Talaromyces proteolyticus]KAH8703385.1 major facilitator superfamily domain-containing protein [Talaromyces proteolyticus]